MQWFTDADNERNCNTVHHHARAQVHRYSGQVMDQEEDFSIEAYHDHMLHN